MLDSNLVLDIIRLSLGAVTAFFAILVWNKTREGAWVCLICACVTRYAGIVWELLEKLGIIVYEGVSLWNIPLPTLLFTVNPSFFIILAFILFLRRK